MGILWKRFFVDNDEKHLKSAEIPLDFCAKWLYNELNCLLGGRCCVGEIFAVLSGKGGTGKTSVCAGIATALAEQGKRVLCIDCDVGLRNLDISLGMTDSGALSFLDVVGGAYPLERAARHPSYQSLSFLTAPMNVSAHEVEPQTFAQMLSQAREEFDYIFLDAPAGVDAGFQLTAKFADRFLVVTGAGPAAVRDAARVSDLLELMGKKNIRLIVNRVDRDMLSTVRLTIDDIMDLSPAVRFLIEIGIALMLMYTCGYSINSFHGLWGLQEVSLWVSIPLTVITVVGLINAVNLIDGVDGYSSGYSIMACAIFGVFFGFVGDITMVMLACTCAASLIPFFLHNVFGRTSKMFIGDGGTLVMGTVMSIFVLNMLKSETFCCVYVDWGMGLVPLTLAILSIPVFDTVRVMSMRMLRGTSPFHPDKTHLHHLFIDMGFSHIGTTISILLINLLNILVWYIAYKCGAGIDVQLYVVVAMALLSTFGFYGLMRRCQVRDNAAWRFMQRIGKFSHIEREGFFLWMQHLMDGK